MWPKTSNWMLLMLINRRVFLVSLIYNWYECKDWFCRFRSNRSKIHYCFTGGNSETFATHSFQLKLVEFTIEFTVSNSMASRLISKIHSWLSDRAVVLLYSDLLEAFWHIGLPEWALIFSARLPIPVSFGWFDRILCQRSYFQGFLTLQSFYPILFFEIKNAFLIGLNMLLFK